MAEHSAGFKVYADSTAFQKGMVDARRAAEEAGKGISKAFEMKDIGRTLATALGLNLEKIADKIVEPFRRAAEEAKELADLTGRVADANLKRSRERLSMDDQLTLAANARMKIEQQISSLSEDTARSKEDEKKLLELQLELDRLITDERQLQEKATREQVALAEQQAKAFMDQRADWDKWLADRQAAADADRKAAEEKKEQERKTTEELKKQKEERAALVRQANEESYAAINKAYAEQQATKAVQERATVMAGIAGIRGGGRVGDASDEALQESIRRNRNAITGMGGILNIGQQIEVARLQAEIQNLQRELDFRTDLRRNVQLGGVEFARSQFQGDPLAFDRLVQQLVEDNRDLRDVLADTNSRLQQLTDGKRSLPVVVLNQQPPRG